ncbi:uncharacterized protein B0H18DRAFT_1000440 [Fomitopsis serialis]|uniref:uncharacterized protein n=1 Tax=Fomitopsis serialis TaxID=139415 RepID=UPI002008A540|nr:uncharacterized protein B0H18DRAFT_1000440 [Neoantrodia serialis]KAH9928745.1 hypothetical protein B0H18DRAFT_1000440 [Neoantrodia serialis]
MSRLVYAQLIVGINASLCDSTLLEATSRSQLACLSLVPGSSAASVAASIGPADVKCRNVGCVKAGDEANARVKR